MIDLIGDIHGHADKLELLLQKLGYTDKHGAYSHPTAKALFIGDYIDRGPKVRETLEIVKRMVDNGDAIALMGNHEYNAICFHYKDPEGGHLRKHSIKNVVQHYDTLKQFQNQQKEYEDYIEWFKSLPLFYETENFRATHACWDDRNIDFLRSNLSDNKLTDDLLYESVREDSILHKAIEETLKGKEACLPEGLSFLDKDGTLRTDIRIKWWENPSKSTYKNISVELMENLPDVPMDLSLLESDGYYSENDKKVFFGHYWLKGQPALFRNNICCLDYSVAKNGHLAAYRFEGELRLDGNKFVYV